MSKTGDMYLGELERKDEIISELLEALERAVLILEGYNGLEAKKMRAVIAKAKGES